MAEDRRHTIFNNHAPVQNQAGRDINSTLILSDLSLEDLRRYASSKNFPELNHVAAHRLEKLIVSLAEADDWITQSYTGEDLKVERLSGERLPLDQCYINLIGVPEVGKRLNNSLPSALDPGDRLSDLSLLRRLNIHGPDGGTQIQLHEIFDHIQLRGGTPQSSKRVLIRGQAGAGKTTFCKKAIHDFIHKMVWKNHFDRILWVRLRDLRFRSRGYNLDEFFHEEFFSQHPNGSDLAIALGHTCMSSSSGKTLFLLDGLDEIWHDLQTRSNLARFVTHLLNQPNVLVLSRPSVVLRSNIHPFDLEVEMIGFSLDQVHQYIRRMEPLKYEAIKEFLESRPLVEDLVRIPIQLDALCYGWDQVQDQGPETMTDLYHAIEKGLWRKDIMTLEKRIGGVLVTENDKVYDTELEKLVEDECFLVEGLAFTGICNNVAEFQERHLNVICRHFSRPGTFADRTLRKLSYLRTSDSSVGKPSRTYHFLHLTLQEYFAARYFERVWRQKGKLVCLNFDRSGALQGNPSSQPRVQPREFFAQHKYSWRHDIMWRFVVGLLHSGPSGSDEGTMRFLMAIDSKPLDLLGLAHQRLIMHSIVELNTSNLSRRLQDHKSLLEDHLGKWAMYQARRDVYRRPTIAEEPEFPIKTHLMMLQHEDPVVCRAALTGSKKWSGARMPSEIADGLKCWLRRAQPPKPVATTDPTSLFNRDGPGLGSILGSMGPILFLAGCAEEESLEEIAIKAFGPPQSWAKDVADAIIGCLDNRSEAAKLAVLDALKDGPEVVAANIDAISSCVDTQLLRWATIELLVQQQHLPKKSLDHLASLLYRSNEKCTILKSTARDRTIREQILGILTANFYWRDFLKSRSTWPVGITEPRCEAQDPIDIDIALINHEDLPNAAITVLALGYYDEKLTRAVINQIVRYLSHEEEFMKLASMDALARQSHLTLEDLQAISACLEDPSDLVKLTAIKALDGRTALADIEDALCSLVMCLGNRSRDIQGAAEKVLATQDGLSETVFKAMVSCFEDESFHNSLNGSSYDSFRKSSRNMPPFAQELLIGIVSHLQDHRWKVRWGVLLLFNGQPKLPAAVLHGVIGCLVDEKEYVRRQAVYVLEGHASDFNEALHTYIRAQLSHADPRKRESVFRALWGTSDASGSLLSLVKEALQDCDADIRLAALQLWIQQPNLLAGVHDAVVDHCEALPPSDSRGRRRLLDMLFDYDLWLTGMNERMVLALVKFLADEDSFIRIRTLDYISRHSHLSQEVLSRMSAFPDDLIKSRGAIFNLLHHGEAYDACLANTNASQLFEILLSRSYVMHVAWYLQGGNTHLETGSGAAHAPLENRREFSRAVKKARKKIGAPDVVVKTIRRWLGLEW